MEEWPEHFDVEQLLQLQAQCFQAEEGSLPHQAEPLQEPEQPWPRNHALEALTEALNRAEVDMLRGPRRTMSLADDNFEEKSLKGRLACTGPEILPPSGGSAGGTNFALQAASQLLGMENRGSSARRGHDSSLPPLLPLTTRQTSLSSALDPVVVSALEPASRAAFQPDLAPRHDHEPHFGLRGACQDHDMSAATLSDIPQPTLPGPPSPALAESISFRPTCLSVDDIGFPAWSSGQCLAPLQPDEACGPQQGAGAVGVQSKMDFWPQTPAKGAQAPQRPGNVASSMDDEDQELERLAQQEMDELREEPKRAMAMPWDGSRPKAVPPAPRTAPMLAERLKAAAPVTCPATAPAASAQGIGQAYAPSMPPPLARPPSFAGSTALSFAALAAPLTPTGSRVLDHADARSYSAASVSTAALMAAYHSAQVRARKKLERRDRLVECVLSDALPSRGQPLPSARSQSRKTPRGSHGCRGSGRSRSHAPPCEAPCLHPLLPGPDLLKAKFRPMDLLLSQEELEGFSLAALPQLALGQTNGWQIAPPKTPRKGSGNLSARAWRTRAAAGLYS